MEIKLESKEDLLNIIKDLKTENTLLNERLDSLTPEPEPEPELESESEEKEPEKEEEEVDEISKLLFE